MSAKQDSKNISPPSAGRSRHGRRVPLQILIMTLAGAVVYFFFGHKIIAAIVWFLACLLFFGFLFAPPIVKGFDRFGVWLGHFVGTVLTHILLVPMYYIVFVLGRIIITVLGCDPLHRKWLPEATSYWEDKAETDDATHFTRQY